MSISLHMCSIAGAMYRAEKSSKEKLSLNMFNVSKLICSVDRKVFPRGDTKLSVKLVMMVGEITATAAAPAATWKKNRRDILRSHAASS